MKRSVTVAGVGVAALMLLRCMPDFDALRSGSSSAGQCSGDCGGTAGDSAIGGDNSTGGTTPIAGHGGTGGKGGSAGKGGEAGVNEGGAAGETTGGTSGSAGTGGSGPPPCITSFDPGVLKYAFDDPTQASAGVLLYPEDLTGKGPGVCMGPIAGTTTDWNNTEGHTCPGALEMIAPFGPDYQSLNQVTVALNFDVADWSVYKTLHAWVKVLSPSITVPKTNPLTYLGALQFSVASNDVPNNKTYAGYLSSTVQMSVVFSDRDWHEVTLTLPVTASSAYFPSAVVNIGIQVQSVGTQPAGGPTSPPTTVVEIDDIWLEPR